MPDIHISVKIQLFLFSRNIAYCVIKCLLSQSTNSQTDIIFTEHIKNSCQNYQLSFICLNYCKLYICVCVWMCMYLVCVCIYVGFCCSIRITHQIEKQAQFQKGLWNYPWVHLEFMFDPVKKKSKIFDNLPAMT